MALTARQRSNQKGAATMRMARRIFEASGALVEPARNVVRWINGKPVSLRHDFFGCWDAIVVFRALPRRIVQQGKDRFPMPAQRERRIFIQVTSVDNMSHRREKILASGFPCSAHDLLLGYRGRGWFRVLRGPTFDGVAEEWKAPPLPKKKEKKETTP